MTQPTHEQDVAAHRAVVEYVLLKRDLVYGSDDIDFRWTKRRVDMLSREIESIFGPDALKNSVEYFTDGKFTLDDMVIFAATEWDRLKQVLAGEAH